MMISRQQQDHIRKKEKILERERNQMKKRNLKWKKLEEGRRH